MRITIRTAGTSLLMAVGLLLSACARDYTDDIKAADQEMDALKKTDLELRQYLTQCISEARQRLNNMLKGANEKLAGDISTRFGNLKSDITTRMGLINSKMGTDFQQKEKLVGEKILAIDNLLKGENGLQARLQKKLDDTNYAVMQHQTDNNNMLADSLKKYRDKLGELTSKVGQLDASINKWRETLEKSKSADWTKQLGELENDIKALEDFKATDELDKMVAALKTFTEEQFWLFETEDLKKLKDYYDKAEELSEKVLAPLSLTEEKLQEFESDFDDYERDVEMMLSDLSTFDTSFSELDDILDQESILEGIDVYIGGIEDIQPLIDDILDKLEEMVSSLDEAEDMWSEGTNEAVEQYGAGGVAEGILDEAVTAFMDLCDWKDDLRDRFPYWDW